MTEPLLTTKHPRIALIDAARGVAIIAMIIYHLAWDLSYFGLIPVQVYLDPGWIAFARAISSTFLFLVGVGLVLGHTPEIRWKAFWKRWVFIAGGAAIITIATVFAFPESFVFFGILHAIALFSLIGLGMLRLPLWLVAALAAVLIVLPMVYADPFFNEKWSGWLGLWTEPPIANDLVPVFPSLGVTLLGITAARLAQRYNLLPTLAAWKLDNGFARGLRFLGRWSLLIYLVHQPLLLAVVYPLSQATQAQLVAQREDFVGSCQSSCMATRDKPAICEAYCACSLAVIDANDLWTAIASPAATPAQQSAVDMVTNQCVIPE